MIGHEGALAALLHQAVAAAIFPLRHADLDGKSPLCQAFSHIIPVDPAAHRRDKGKLCPCLAQDVGRVEGAAAQGHGLAGGADILLGHREMVNIYDDVHTGGADYQNWLCHWFFLSFS